MKNLKRLGVAVALTFLLGLSALAGETQSPPCAPPDPGETQSPPCATAQMTPAHPATQGQTNTPAVSNTETDLLITEAAIDILQSLLSIF